MFLCLLICNFVTKIRDRGLSCGVTVTALDVDSKDQNLRSSYVALRKSLILCTPESCQEDAAGLGIADLRNFLFKLNRAFIVGCGNFWEMI